MKWHVLLFWLEESRLNQSTSLDLLLTIQRLWSLIFPQNLGSYGSYVCVGGGGRVYMWVWYACGKQRSTLCLESGSLIGLELAEKASMAGQGAQGWPCLFLPMLGLQWDMMLAWVLGLQWDIMPAWVLGLQWDMILACVLGLQWDMGAGVTTRHDACMGAGARTQTFMLHGILCSLNHLLVLRLHQGLSLFPCHVMKNYLL